MSIIDFLIQGFLGWPWWKIVVYMLVTTHITIACVTIYLHRGQAHRAMDLHWIPEQGFRFWLYIATGMVTREWVAIHRKHHAKCETLDDPHSPVAHGIKKVFWQGAELYRVEAKNEETLKKYGQGAPDDWIERNLYSRYRLLGISLMLIVNILLFGAIGFTVWAVQMAWIPLLAAGVVNGVGHYWGYRTFSPPDQSTNIVPWGILIGGEELHNNHHTYPTSAKLSVRWYEFDIGWLYIRVLEFFHLATVKRHNLAPRVKFSTEANSLEATIEVVRDLRFELLREFDEYIKRLQESEGDSELEREWKLRLRNKATVLRQELTTLWTDKAHTVESQAHDFALWCNKASQSGILFLDGLVSKLPFLRVVRRWSGRA